MAHHGRLSAGDLARLVAEITAQLPEGYDPYTDFWSVPYDCDCCTGALAEGVNPMEVMPEATPAPFRRRWRRSGYRRTA